MLDIEKLCDDYMIPCAVPGNKHYRDGWLNIPCPMCGSSGDHFHLGYNMYKGYFHCHVCQWLSPYKVIQEMCDTKTKGETIEILKKYEVSQALRLDSHVDTVADKCEMPHNAKPLKKMHRKYLIKRNFNPADLVEDWGLQGTPYDGTFNGERVFAPIYYKGILCSYQGRSINKEEKIKYVFCPKKEEVVHSRQLVYGFDQAIFHGRCILVEGIFDVWRLGFGAVSVFGIAYTQEQVRLLAKNFKSVYIMFDREKGAQKQANKLKSELELRGVNVELIYCPDTADDPAELTQEEADDLMEEYGFL